MTAGMSVPAGRLCIIFMHSHLEVYPLSRVFYFELLSWYDRAHDDGIYVEPDKYGLLITDCVTVLLIHRD